MGEAIVKKGEEWALFLLHGKVLSAVVFVQDYLQLQFDGPRLDAFTSPAVVVGDHAVKKGMEGWRDRLCEQITKTVVATRVTPDQEICVDFEDGSAITISLRKADMVGAEAALFNAGPPTKEWMVWN